MIFNKSLLKLRNYRNNIFLLEILMSALLNPVASAGGFIDAAWLACSACSGACGTGMPCVRRLR
jgi:hypothetical protein